MPKTVVVVVFVLKPLICFQSRATPVNIPARRTTAETNTGRITRDVDHSCPLPPLRLRVSLLAQVPHLHRHHCPARRPGTYSDCVWCLFFQEVLVSLDREDANIIQSKVWWGKYFKAWRPQSSPLGNYERPRHCSGNLEEQLVEWSVSTLWLRQWHKAEILVEPQTILPDLHVFLHLLHKYIYIILQLPQSRYRHKLTQEPPCSWCPKPAWHTQPLGFEDTSQHQHQHHCLVPSEPTKPKPLSYVSQTLFYPLVPLNLNFNVLYIGFFYFDLNQTFTCQCLFVPFSSSSGVVSRQFPMNPSCFCPSCGIICLDTCSRMSV